MDEAIRVLVGTSPEGGTQWLGELRRTGGMLDRRFDHLACYFPGNLALGVQQGAVGAEKAPLYMAIAANLTRTCWLMYERMPSGLLPLTRPLYSIRLLARLASS